MQSRQIQVFGLIGSAVLVLFIVIFLGKDFHRLYLKHAGEISHEVVAEGNTPAETEVIKVPVVAEAVSQQQPKTVAETSVPAVKQEEEVASPPVQEERTKVNGTGQAKVESDLPPVRAETPETINKEIARLLREAHFFRYSMALTQKNKALLDKVADRLSEISFPYMIEIEGHTERGLSKRASEQMARGVEAYLQNRLPGVTIKIVGYGDAYPIIDDPESLENRRVEIIVRRRDV